MSDLSYGGSIPIARLSFNHANQPFVSPARRLDRAATRQMDRPKRLDAVRAKLRNHCQRHKPVWIGRETVRLTNQRIKARFDHPAPRGAARQSLPLQNIARQARQNVEARITKRLSRLNTMRPEFKQKASQTAHIKQTQQQRYGMKR